MLETGGEGGLEALAVGGHLQRRVGVAPPLAEPLATMRRLAEPPLELGVQGAEEGGVEAGRDHHQERDRPGQADVERPRPAGPGSSGGGGHRVARQAEGRAPAGWPCPPGRTPRAAGCPSRPAATSRTVPSPPKAKTTSEPWRPARAPARWPAPRAVGPARPRSLPPAGWRGWPPDWPRAAGAPSGVVDQGGAAHGRAGQNSVPVVPGSWDSRGAGRRGGWRPGRGGCAAGTPPGSDRARRGPRGSRGPRRPGGAGP